MSNVTERDKNILALIRYHSNLKGCHYLFRGTPVNIAHDLSVHYGLLGSPKVFALFDRRGQVHNLETWYLEYYSDPPGPLDSSGVPGRIDFVRDGDRHKAVLWCWFLLYWDKIAEDSSTNYASLPYIAFNSTLNTGGYYPEFQLYLDGKFLGEWRPGYEDLARTSKLTIHGKVGVARYDEEVVLFSERKDFSCWICGTIKPDSRITISGRTTGKISKFSFHFDPFVLNIPLSKEIEKDKDIVITVRCYEKHFMVYCEGVSRPIKAVSDKPYENKEKSLFEFPKYQNIRLKDIWFEEKAYGEPVEESFPFGLIYDQSNEEFPDI